MGQHDKAADDTGSGTVLPERVGSGKASDLSEGERALIYRRRMRLSQKAMAKSFGMDRREYGVAEAKGTLKLPGFMVVVEPLEPHEQCFLWRHRSGWTQQECADLMGITRYWYNLMENGRAPSDRLEAFWDER